MAVRFVSPRVYTIGSLMDASRFATKAEAEKEAFRSCNGRFEVKNTVR
jgi:hypothetical protein